MAGDWLKMRLDLDEDPAVIGIVERTGESLDSVLGKLYRLWRWANRQSRDGHAPVSISFVDRYVGVPGFAEAMIEVGWLESLPEPLTRGTSGGFRIPKWDRHNSKSAKKRALALVRKQDQRSRNGHADVPPSAGLEKRRGREEKNTQPPTPFPEEGGGEMFSEPPERVSDLPLPEPLDNPEFRAHWSAYLRHLLELRKPISVAAARTLLSKLGRWGIARALDALAWTIEANCVTVKERPAAEGGKPAKKPKSEANKEVIDEWLRARRNTQPGSSTTPTASGSPKPTPPS